MTASSDDFNPLSFEKKLTNLKDTQESIQYLSGWCLQQKQHHKKIVACWLNVLKRAKVEQRLTLFYLANDVIQYSKRKKYDFVESWGTTLQKATPLVRDDKVKHRILRIFRIWEERSIYDEEFLTDLTGLLSAAAGKQTSDVDANDFQATLLVNKIRQCSVLESDTDQQLKNIHECPLALNDTESLTSVLKDRRDIGGVKKELDDGISRLQDYVRSLQKELVARAALCHMLQKAHEHYNTQWGEVKVVANAYKSFGNRVRGLKRKLDDLTDSLPEAPRPVIATDRASPLPSPPSPGEAVPSPGPDEDLDLPGQQESVNGYNLDKTFSSSILGDEMASKGFTSFMGQGDFPFFQEEKKLPGKDDKGGNRIEVISSRPVTTPREDFNINDFLKSLLPPKPSLAACGEEPTRYSSSILTPPPPPPLPLLPGLDLLPTPSSLLTPTPTTLLPPPPPPPKEISLTPNFYVSNTSPGTPEPVGVPAPEPYMSDHGAHWNNGSWESLQSGNISSESPESPPLLEQVTHVQSPNPSFLEAPPPPPPPRPDVDHRKLLAFPPPPHLPDTMLDGDDVDHRMLPPLPQPMSQTPERNRQISHKGDVDHRNLISLTGSLPPPPAPPVTPWDSLFQPGDQDYRHIGQERPLLPPPHSPPQLRHKSSSGQRSPDYASKQSSRELARSSSHPGSVSSVSPNHSQTVSSLPPNMMSHPPIISTLPPNMPSHPQPTAHNQSPSISHLPPSSMLQHPPGMLQSNQPLLPPSMLHHPSIVSQLPPNIPQHHPNMSQHPPSLPQHPPNIAQPPTSLPQPPVTPLYLPDMSQLPPNLSQPLLDMSQLPPNIVHHQQPGNMGQYRQLPPNMMNRPVSYPDNVESIDMEMSDEEMHDIDDTYNHARVELTHSRMHGKAPSNQVFRQAENTFNNNNKILVGGNDSPRSSSTFNTNAMDPSWNDDERKNLVRINSVQDEDIQSKSPQSEARSLEILSNESESNDDKQNSPINDVFDNRFSSSMNPSNPNFEVYQENENEPALESFDKNPDKSSQSPPEPDYSDANENWEEEDSVHEESLQWQNRITAMNPMRPILPQIRPFQMRPPIPRLRHPPIFNRPPPNNMFYNNFNPRGRPWGLRPPRFW